MGARTAIGDLPPYFMARARLPAADPDDEEHPRFEEEEEMLDQTAQVQKYGDSLPADTTEEASQRRDETASEKVAPIRLPLLLQKFHRMESCRACCARVKTPAYVCPFERRTEIKICSVITSKNGFEILLSPNLSRHQWITVSRAFQSRWKILSFKLQSDLGDVFNDTVNQLPFHI